MPKKQNDEDDFINSISLLYLVQTLQPKDLMSKLEKGAQMAMSIPVIGFTGTAGILSLIISTTLSQAKRNWQHELLRQYGHQPCYAIFLLFPTDKELMKYLTENGKEVDVMSQNACLVLALTDKKLAGTGFFEKEWTIAVKAQSSQGHSAVIANILEIPFTDFPCMIIFEDIRSPKFIKVALKDLNVENIVYKVREIFSVIRNAVKKAQSPIEALEGEIRKKRLGKAGQTVFAEVRNFSGKALETAMKTIIESYLPGNS